MKRIFIFSSHALLGHGIGELLRHEAGVEIVGQEADLQRAMERIAVLAPDVVVVDAQGVSSDWAMFMAHSLQKGSQSCVIAVNLENNVISIYHGEHKTMRDVGDFLHAIQD